MTQLHADHGGQHPGSKHLGGRPAQHTEPTQHIQPTQYVQSARPLQTDAVFGTVFFEVLLSADTPPTVPGWTLRLWPRARLGDATLEARADGAQTTADLIAGLGEQGVRALGPVRHRRS